MRIFTVVCLMMLLAAPAWGQSRLARIQLGKELYFERGLSDDGTVSCATCHDPALGYADGQRVAVGVRGRTGERNTPTVLLAAFKPLQFHDGRVRGINLQAIEPIQNVNEMGDQSRADVMNRLRRSPHYVAAFRRAFGNNPGGSVITQERFGLALAEFQGTLVPRDTPFERRAAGYRHALSPAAERGYQLMQRANCFDCHAGAPLTDRAFHNNGVSFFLRDDDRGRSDILPVEEQTAADQGAFATPTLVCVVRTAPYMHNGALPDLASVVRGYNRGWVRDDGRGRLVEDRYQDRRIRPLGWSAADEADVVRALQEGTEPRIYPWVEDPHR